MPNFKIPPQYTSEVETVTMMSRCTFLNDELTRAAFPLSKINPENPHEEFNFCVKRIQKRMIPGGGHFFKRTDDDADGRIMAVTSRCKPGGKQ